MLRDDYKQKQKLGSCDTWENEEMKNQKCSFLHMLVKVDLNKTHADVPWNLRKLMEKVSDCYPITGSSSSQKSNFLICFSVLFIFTVELFYDSFSNL